MVGGGGGQMISGTNMDGVDQGMGGSGGGIGQGIEGSSDGTDKGQ
jgi:hypothetical protein